MRTTRSTGLWGRWRFGLLFLLFVCAYSGQAWAGFSKITTIQTRQTSQDHASFARTVKWIDWDSSFRGSGLLIGDRIIGVDGEFFNEETLRRRNAVGDGAENSYWSKRGKKPGDSIRLMVQRDSQTIEIPGQLAKAGWDSDSDGKRIMGLGGPRQNEKDGFSTSWYAWYDRFLREVGPLLGNEYYAGINTLTARQRIEKSRWDERVAFLTRNFPGPFADAVNSDWIAAKKIVDGKKIDLSEEDLEYRRLGAIRAAQIATASDEAFASFLKELGDQLLVEPFPAPKPPKESLADIVGKMVSLPPSEKVIQESVVRSERAYIHVTGQSQGDYLIDRRNPRYIAIYQALDRYVDKVTPEFDNARFSFVGKILETPLLVYDVRRDRTVYGIEVEPHGVFIEETRDRSKRVFLDLRSFDGQTPLPFAGESELLAIDVPPVTPGSKPEEVFNSFVKSVKFSNRTAWRAFYRTWKIRNWSTPALIAWRPLSGRTETYLWDHSRKRLLNEVYDIGVARVGPISLVYEGPGLNGDTSRVEEVELLAQHVGKIDGEFRTFLSPAVTRRWTLQRLDGGPWMIATEAAP